MSKLTRRSVVLLALCAGVLAALLSYVYLQRQRVRTAQLSQPVTVVVAAQEVPARTVIEPGMVYETRRPVGALPPNCAVSKREVVGRVTTAALAAEAPVQRSAVSTRTASLGLAYIVPEGMRAVTVALDPIIGVAGFLKPGDHVDVLATFTMDKVSVTKTVLQHVELLAIGPEVLPEEMTDRQADKSGKPKEQPNATLAVTPQEAEKLILAESEGKLRLILRPAGDQTWVTLSGIRSDYITGLRPASRTSTAAARPRANPTPPPVYHAPPPTYTRPTVSKPAPAPKNTDVAVDTIRGSKKTTVEVKPE